MKVAVILNYHAGADSTDPVSAEGLRSAFRAVDVDAEIVEARGAELAETAENLLDSNADVIGVAGGDGSISAVAGVLAGGEKPLAVIPAGTFNHFAKDLNIPTDMEAAVGVIAEGEIRDIDVAEVNGRVFINNSSVGLYPRAVKQREEYLQQLGGGKTVAMTLASLSMFTRFPLFNVKLKVEEKDIIYTTPFVFIGNNEYKLDLFNLGTRADVTRGELCLYTANCRTRWSIVRLLFFAINDRIEQETDFDLRLVQGVTLETRKKEVRVSLDGEILPMQPPLHYKIRPKDLKVILPRKSNR